MEYYLCADQGGSKTHVILCSENGSILGAAAGEAAALYYNDPENRTTLIVRELAEQILTSVSLSWDCITAVCSGIICLDWPFETPIHENRLRDVLPVKNVIALNDSLIALRAGSSRPNKCIICAGTGLNIAAQTSGGKTFVYGNYIPMRMMGGLALGGLVIDAAGEAETGVRPSTALTNMLLKYTGYENVESLFMDLSTGKYDFSRQYLVPGLIDHALDGDAASIEIINSFTEKLTVYTAAMIKRMGLAGIETELVYSGGIFKNKGRHIADAVTKKLSLEFPLLQFVHARLEPVCGAMLTVLDKKYNGNIPQEILINFERGCEKFKLLRIYEK